MKEKERKELMEQKRLRKQRMRSRKVERQIAARMSAYEMEQSRKRQAQRRLHCFRKQNREQAAQYQAELKQMKERVARAPFLFEQVTQNNVRGTIDRLFSRILQKVQLDEELVCTLSTAGCRDEVEFIELEGEAETHAHE
ncbi:testis-specific protein 10-interacting protein-like, partial [Heptranchias perlo]|uniref:testis-specific protein 10-interacting protein-like n=1 Tax=Heptranchias perlo TaxID=212740 RepID=UPI003559F71D